MVKATDAGIRAAAVKLHPDELVVTFKLDGHGTRPDVERAVEYGIALSGDDGMVRRHFTVELGADKVRAFIHDVHTGSRAEFDASHVEVLPAMVSTRFPHEVLGASCIDSLTAFSVIDGIDVETAVDVALLADGQTTTEPQVSVLNTSTATSAAVPGQCSPAWVRAGSEGQVMAAVRLVEAGGHEACLT